ncbi:plastocyanin/azurin family copper-binding protein [Methanohalobium sp.]|uniref:plastocyanin/azurin family copper-binding protein n=1 Tax=Methanohalobium sp. TaxID=2837493 RepID=UPI0025E8C86B|nr:plastocyanin/azurin family copper-binding protein [Methanohalobium sp.]
MKDKLIILIVIVAVFLAIGCAQQPDDNGETDTNGMINDSGNKTPDKTALPQPDGQELHNYITEVNNYKDWRLWPGTSRFSNGSEPHGSLVTVYVSDEAYSSIENKTGVMSNGSIIVKEDYNSDRELQGLSVMYKVEGFDENHNDWFWAFYGPNESINAEGQVEACYDCHGIEENNDYLYTGNIRTNETMANETEQTDEGETVEIEIEDFEFKPNEVTISPGDTVKWANLDSATHNARQTIDNPEFYSPNLQQGDSFNHTFDEEGTYDYICTIHPYMEGTVTVE